MLKKFIKQIIREINLITIIVKDNKIDGNSSKLNKNLF